MVMFGNASYVLLFVAHLVCLITVLNGSLKSCILCLFRFIWSVLLPYQMDLSVISMHCLDLSILFVSMVTTIIITLATKGFPVWVSLATRGFLSNKGFP